MAETKNSSDRAADIVRAHKLLPISNKDQNDLRNLLRRWIAGLSPDAADAAIVELFNEVQIYDDMMMESFSYASEIRRWWVYNTLGKSGHHAPH
jgi:hypothetical protein